MSEYILAVGDSLGIGLDWIVKVSMLFVLVSGVTWLMRRGSAAVRHRVWSLAILGCYAIPIASCYLPALTLPVLPGTSLVRPASFPQIANETSGTKSVAVTELPGSIESTVEISPMEVTDFQRNTPLDQAELQSPAIANAPEVKRSAFSILQFPWKVAVVFLWLLGMICLLTRLAFGCQLCRSLMKRAKPISDPLSEVVHKARLAMGLRGPVDARLSDETHVPLAIGIFRSQILLPVEGEGWTATRQRCAVLHELVHHERCDVAWQMTAQVACSIYWFHPLVWYAAHRLRIERELACDDRVIQIDDQAADYAQQLVDMARFASHAQFAGAVAMAQKSGLEHRIVAIFDRARSHMPLSRNGAIRLALVMLVCIVSIAILKPSARALQLASVGPTVNVNADSGVSLEFRGKIDFPEGTPAQPVVIDVYQSPLPTNSKELFLTVNSSDGKFQFASRRLGAMTIHARTKDSSFQATQLHMHDGLVAKSVDGITLAMEKAKTVAFKVFDAEVPVSNAKVQVNTNDASFHGTTDDSGIANIRLPKSALVMEVRAHTADRRLASLALRSEIKEKQLAMEYVLPLGPCKKLTIRAVDKSGIPMANVPIELGCEDANYRWVLQDDLFEGTTDDRGEVSFKYIPTWPNGKTHMYVKADEFYVEKSEDSSETLKQVTIASLEKTEEVEYQLELPEGCPAGLFVHGSSFQSVRDHYSSFFYSRVDKTGRFKARIVPGYTYVVQVEDARWVTPSWHGILIDSKTGAKASPSLNISKGIPVEISVTTGSAKKPAKNQYVQASSPHGYSWKDQETGKIRHGTSGRLWQVTTDEHGKATVMAPTGELDAHVSSGSQYVEGKVDVSLGQPAQLSLHLPVDGQTELKGFVSMPAGTAIPNQKIQVKISQADSSFVRPDAMTTCDSDGRFKAMVESSRVKIYAESEDKTYSGAMVCGVDQSNIEVKLSKTGEITGTILDETGKPRVDCEVWASASIKNIAPKADLQIGVPALQQLSIGRWEAKTNERGEFSLRGLLARTRIMVGVNGKERYTFDMVTECALEPGEVHHAEPVGFDPKPTVEVKPITDRFSSLLQTNRSFHTRALVIVSGGGGNATKFVDDHALDGAEHSDIYRFIPMSLSPETLEQHAANKSAFSEKNWNLDSSDSVLAVAYDNDGRELGRLKLDTTKESAEPANVKVYEQFLETHKPAQEDAEEKLDRALADAKATQRRVWVVLSGTRCGPCRVMARWMHAQKALLDKAIVHVHLDEALDSNAAKIRKRLNDPQGGIPWHAILDVDGSILINSETEILGNVGGPDKSSGNFNQFRQMIEVACKGKLTEVEMAALIESVKNP